MNYEHEFSDWQTVGEAIEQIAALPVRMRDAVSGLTDAQLDTPYRPDGWTVRQVVHHVADSHMNGFTRIKLALTDAGISYPLIEQAYAEKRTDASGSRTRTQHSPASKICATSGCR